jgi:tetratricopeptide (TPR) repeat protein
VLALTVIAQINLCECLRTWAPDTGEMERIGEAALDKALVIRPDSTSLLSLRGWLLLKRGRHEDALLVADQVLARDPDDGETMRLRVIALFKLGRIEQSAAAIPALLKANDTRWTQANVATVLFRQRRRREWGDPVGPQGTCADVAGRARGPHVRERRAACGGESRWPA